MIIKNRQFLEANHLQKVSLHPLLVKSLLEIVNLHLLFEENLLGKAIPQLKKEKDPLKRKIHHATVALLQDQNQWDRVVVHKEVIHLSEKDNLLIDHLTIGGSIHQDIADHRHAEVGHLLQNDIGLPVTVVHPLAEVAPLQQNDIGLHVTVVLLHHQEVAKWEEVVLAQGLLLDDILLALIEEVLQENQDKSHYQADILHQDVVLHLQGKFILIDFML